MLLCLSDFMDRKIWIGIIIIAIILISGCATTQPIKDCNYYCSQEGLAVATNEGCIPFNECNDPDEPLTAEICEGVELCCCKV